jgi:hypothetical protein
MSMRKIILVIAMVVLLPPAFLGAQQTEGIEAERLGKDQAQQELVEVSVSKFEDVAFWGSSMMLDEGIAAIRRFEGKPMDKEPIPGEQSSDIQETDRYVLGAKVVFFRRGESSVSVFPVRPIPIEGITKTISVWVVGRNFNHTLKVIVADYFNQPREITMGKLNFMGWKKLTAAIPPRIVQDEYHFTSDRGLKLIGLRIDFDLMESYGTYYVYFDGLRAVTDLFAETYRDPDDMTDGW